MLDVDTGEHSGGLVQDESEVILGSEGVSRIGSLGVLELKRKRSQSARGVGEKRRKRRATNDGELLRIVDDWERRKREERKSAGGKAAKDEAMGKRRRTFLGKSAETSSRRLEDRTEVRLESREDEDRERVGDLFDRRRKDRLISERNYRRRSDEIFTFSIKPLSPGIRAMVFSIPFMTLSRKTRIFHRVS